MLSSQTQAALRGIGIEAQHACDFLSGLKLLHLICHAFYEGDNPHLTNKLRIGDSQKTGNNVLNINILLNYLKKDQNGKIDEHIKELTAFQLIEDESIMIQFVQWLITKIHQGVREDSIEQEKGMSTAREQDNDLDNLYFVASLKKPQLQDNCINQDLIPQNQAEKVVRKGSFKMLRPKADSSSKSERSSNEKIKEPLRQVIMVNSNNKASMTFHGKDNEEEDQLQCRKTVPKMAERPPLHRSRAKAKQFKDNIKFAKGPTAEPTDQHIYIEEDHSRQDLMKGIESINREIQQEEQSLSLLQQQPVHSKTENSTRKSSRKIFKMQVNPLPEARKKAILEWLIATNLLEMSSSSSLYDLHELHKDGVLFMQIADYFKGRGRDLCYFRKPKRSAQMHSNYQKLFTILEELPEFRCELIHHYEFFIPEAQENSFWELLGSMQNCYQKKQPSRKESAISRYENEVSRRVQRGSSRRKRSEQTQCEDSSRFGSAVVQKGRKRQMSEVSTHKKVSFSSNTQSRKESVDIPRKVAPSPSDQYCSSAQRIAAYGLVQKQEPSEDSASQERGYRDLYLCKFKNVQTPHKNRSFCNSSLSRSRLRTSLNASSRKKEQSKPQVPSVTLEMQMKVLAYLKGMGVKEEALELFKDPFRNGLLLNSIVRREWGVDCEIIFKPKNIQDCRKNYGAAIEAIRVKRSYALPYGYEYFIEDLIKGEKNLIYGAIWAVIQPQQHFKGNKNLIQTSDFDDRVRSYSSKSEEWMITWVRHLEKHSPQIASFKIRSENELFSAVVNSRFLFDLAVVMTGRKTVSPAYNHPTSLQQKEANLKKILGFLVQNNILRSDYLWKTKALARQDENILADFLNSLITQYYRLNQKQQVKSVNFIKYLTRHNEKMDRTAQIQPNADPIELNQTNIIENTFSKQVAQPQQPQKVEVPWMRKLGFRGSLKLNNGLILCRLISKLTMKTIEGVNQRPQSKAECLGNIRRALKLIPKFKWDQFDIEQSDYDLTMEIYTCLKQKYKHTYALKGL